MTSGALLAKCQGSCMYTLVPCTDYPTGTCTARAGPTDCPAPMGAPCGTRSEPSTGRDRARSAPVTDPLAGGHAEPASLQKDIAARQHRKPDSLTFPAAQWPTPADRRLPNRDLSRLEGRIVYSRLHRCCFYLTHFSRQRINAHFG